jgi:glycerate dehydrogenase
MAMKAVFLDYSTVGPGLDTSPLTALLPSLEIFDGTQDDQVLDRISDAEFVFANKIRISDALFDAAPKLRFIGLTATGTDNIDLDSARRYGVAVCNIRGYCSSSVTEHVFGVLLMLAHNLHTYTTAVRDGAWQKSENFCMLTYPVRELSSMTMGRRPARTFRCRLIALPADSGNTRTDRCGSVKAHEELSDPDKHGARCAHRLSRTCKCAARW